MDLEVKKRFDNYSEMRQVFSNKDVNNEIFWENAKQLYEIMEKQLYLIDFDSSDSIADYIGLSKGTISKYKNAYKFSLRYKFDYKLYPFSTVYQLSVLKNDYPYFLEYLENKGIELENCSRNKVIAEIKQFRSTRYEEVKKIVKIEKDGYRYEIPYEILKQYRVE